MAVRRENGADNILSEAHKLYDQGYDIHWIVPPVLGDSSIKGNGKKLVYARRGRIGRLEWGELENTYQEGYNLGFRPGPTSVVGGGEIVVIDVDGSGDIRDLVGGEEPTTLSGSGAGTHYFVRVPIGSQITQKRLWQGAGRHNEVLVIASGGNVVLPPSLHWSGGHYQWVNGGRIIDASPSLLKELSGETDAAVDSDFEIGPPVNLRDIGPTSTLAAAIRNGIPREGKSKSEVIWEVVAGLHRMGIPREQILGTLLNEEWGVSEKIYAEGGGRRRIEERARKEVARIIAKVDAEDRAASGRLESLLSEFNEKYCHVLYKASARVCYRDEGEIGFMKAPAFREFYAHLGYSTASAHIDPAKIWLAHPDTPVYHRVGFDPAQPPYRDGGEMLNLWQGFAVSPVVGGSGGGMFREHLLRNVCRGDAELMAWLWNWFAHIFQRPWEKPGTAVVLRGGTGTGKSVVAQVICRLIGPAHSLSTSNPDLLTSRFNSILGNKIFVCGEEISWGGDNRGNAILKDRITAGTVQIEPKGIDSFTVRSCHRYMLITNELWPVNVMPQERRYALFEVGDGSQRDEKFFGSMLKGLEKGGYGQLMNELLATSVNDSWLRNPPVTAATREAQERSLNPVGRWIEKCLRRGWFYRNAGSAGWLVRVDPERMVSECRNSIGKSGDYVTPAEIKGEIRRLFGGWNTVTGRIPGITRKAWGMPKSLRDARLRFDRVMGTRGDWSDET